MLKEKFERVKRKMIYQYEGTPINLTAAISIKRMEAKKKKKNGSQKTVGWYIQNVERLKTVNKEFYAQQNYLPSC